MLANAIYIGTKPQINIVPKMLVSIAECAMNGEHYCTFCMMGDDKFEKVVNKVCKGLEQNGYETEVYYVWFEEEEDRAWYVKVKWKDGVFGYVGQKGMVC